MPFSCPYELKVSRHALDQIRTQETDDEDAVREVSSGDANLKRDYRIGRSTVLTLGASL